MLDWLNTCEVRWIIFNVPFVYEFDSYDREIPNIYIGWELVKAFRKLPSPALWKSQTAIGNFVTSNCRFIIFEFDIVAAREERAIVNRGFTEIREISEEKLQNKFDPTQMNGETERVSYFSLFTYLSEPVWMIQLGARRGGRGNRHSGGCWRSEGAVWNHVESRRPRNGSSLGNGHFSRTVITRNRSESRWITIATLVHER